MLDQVIVSNCAYCIGMYEKGSVQRCFKLYLTDICVEVLKKIVENSSLGDFQMRHPRCGPIVIYIHKYKLESVTTSS
jgi:hypothetical protein